MSEEAHVCSRGCRTLDSLSCCMKSCSRGDGRFHSLGHKVVLVAQGARERRQNAPGCPPVLLHQRHPHEPVGLTLQARAQGNLPPQTPPLKEQPAGTWTDTCTNRHRPAFWRDHPGSPSPCLLPPLAVLNTNAFCHLVILGKKDCSWRQQSHKVRRDGAAPGLGGSPGFIPCWYNGDGVCWYRKSPTCQGCQQKGSTTLWCLVGPWHGQGLAFRLLRSTGHSPIGSNLAPALLLGDRVFPKHQKQSHHLLLGS